MIIGICGGTASGKTTFTQKVLKMVDPIYVVHIEQDVYYHNIEDLPLKLRKNRNFDHPNSIDKHLFIEHVMKLKKNQPINQPVYDFTTDSRKPETKRLNPKPIIIVEGVLIFAIEKLRNFMDIKVFIDADNDLRLSRRMLRDITERGRTPESVIHQYLNTVRPMHSQFVEPYKQYADLIVSGNSENYVGIDLIVTKIKTQIAHLKLHNS